MSVLTQAIKKRQQWNYLYEAKKRNSTHANFDWLLYIVAGILVYTYRVEVIEFLVDFLEKI